jgi:hypothetical protein
VLLVHEFCLCFFETVEGVRGLRVARLVRVDQEGFDAVAFLDVGFGDARLEVEDGVAVKESVLWWGFLKRVYVRI